MLTAMGVSLSRLMAPLLPSLLSAHPTPANRSHPSSASTIHAAEATLLSHLTTTPYAKRAVHLPRTGYTLNTLSAGSLTSPTLLLLHGWGAGAAFFGRNLSGLSKHFRIHVIDWPGFGASSRPHHDSGMSAEEAEGFFVEPLAEWVDVMRGVEQFEGGLHVVGHSMGALLSVAFTLKYPRLVKNLVLVSPVGVPKAPKDKLGEMKGGRCRRLLIRGLFWLWEKGWTPQVLVRGGGRWLGRIVAGCMIRERLRIEGRGVGEQAVVEYFYQISAAEASGEYALNTVLESGAYARRPLCERLGAVKVPVVLLYGERDWMSVDAGREVARELAVKNWVGIVEDAGHHVYFDNANEFNRLVLRACRDDKLR